MSTLFDDFSAEHLTKPGYGTSEVRLASVRPGHVPRRHLQNPSMAEYRTLGSKFGATLKSQPCTKYRELMRGDPGPPIRTTLAPEGEAMTAPATQEAML